MSDLDLNFTPQKVNTYAGQWIEATKEQQVLLWIILSRLASLLFIDLPEQFEDELSQQFQQFSEQFIDDPLTVLSADVNSFEALYAIKDSSILDDTQDEVKVIYSLLSSYYTSIDDTDVEPKQMTTLLSRILFELHELLDLLYQKKTTTHGSSLYEINDGKSYIWERVVNFLNILPGEILEQSLREVSGDEDDIKRSEVYNQLLTDLLVIDEVIMDFF